RWALRPHAAEVVASRIIQDKPPIPLIALMAWMWRHREITDLDGALQDFVAELGLARDGFIGPVFSDEIPKEFREAGLASKPLELAEVADLTGASQPQAPIAVVTDWVVRLRDFVQDDFF